MTAKKSPERKPWTSGFCNPSLPRTDDYDPHTRCSGCDCQARGCHNVRRCGCPIFSETGAVVYHRQDCEWNVRKITVPAIAPLTVPDLTPGDSPSEPVPPITWSFTDPETGPIAVPPPRPSSIAAVAQALAEKRVHLNGRIDPELLKTTPDPWTTGAVDALTYAIAAIMYGPDEAEKRNPL